MLTPAERTKPDDRQPTRLWPVYKWSLSFLKPYTGLLLALVLTMMVVSTAELIVPKFIQHFIDRILPERDWQAFYRMVAALGGVIAVVVAVGMAQNLLARMLREKTARSLQTAIFVHLRKLGFAYYEQNPVGQTLSFLNTEVGALQELYRRYFPLLISGAVFSFVALIMMVTTSFRLSLIVVPSFLLYYLLGPALERKASLLGKRMAQERVEENRKVYESVSALTELRVFAAEPWDLKRYLDKVKTYNEAMVKTNFYAYLRGSNRRITYYIGAIFIFVYGYYLLRRGELLIGEFVSFLLYYFNAMFRLTIVVTNITEQKVLMYQAQRLYDFIRLEPDVREAARPRDLTDVRGEIRFERVGFAYPSGGAVLDDFSLTVRAGERVALVGTSGNGKSTALKLIGRFYDPQRGRILLDGVPLTELSFRSLRQSLGFVFQDMYMFGSTVRENLLFGNPDATEEQLVAAARAAYAHDFIAGLPHGYDTVVGERGVKLSGGQKQRIAIARMLIGDPAVVLLDEATSALDNASESEVQKAFATLLRGRTLIAVAHRLSTVRDFDRIALIEGGRVAELGSYDELMAAGGLFAQLVGGAAMAGTEMTGTAMTGTEVTGMTGAGAPAPGASPAVRLAKGEEKARG